MLISYKYIFNNILIKIIPGHIYLVEEWGRLQSYMQDFQTSPNKGKNWRQLLELFLIIFKSLISS